MPTPARSERPTSFHRIPDRLGSRKTNAYTMFVLADEQIRMRTFRSGGISAALAVGHAGEDADQILFIFSGEPTGDALDAPVGPGGRQPARTRPYTVLARRGDEFALQHIRFGGGVDELQPLRDDGWEPFFAQLNHISDMRGVTLIPRVAGPTAAPSVPR